MFSVRFALRPLASGCLLVLRHGSPLARPPLSAGAMPRPRPWRRDMALRSTSSGGPRHGGAPCAAPLSTRRCRGAAAHVVLGGFLCRAAMHRWHIALLGAANAHSRRTCVRVCRARVRAHTHSNTWCGVVAAAPRHITSCAANSVVGDVAACARVWGGVSSPQPCRCSYCRPRCWWAARGAWSSALRLWQRSTRLELQRAAAAIGAPCPWLGARTPSHPPRTTNACTPCAALHSTCHDYRREPVSGRVWGGAAVSPRMPPQLPPRATNGVPPRAHTY